MAITLNGTTGGVFPTWTTAGRPSSPVAGQTGYNSTLGILETWNGSVWNGSNGAAPAFSAYNSIATSCPNASTTKLQYSNVEFDTASCYDATTNYRYTPNVAGYYLVTGASTIAGGGVMALHIFKNGSIFKTGGQIVCSGSYAQATVAAVIYLNGSSDYIELHLYNATGSTTTVYTGGQPFYCYFQAIFMRGT